MADSINNKAKEYYDNDNTGGSLNNNLKDFLKQQGAEGNSLNTLWRNYAYGEGGNSLNTRLGKLWGTSGSLIKRWKDVLGLTWDDLKLFFNARRNDPELLLSGATSFDGSNDYIDCGTGLGTDLGDNYSGSLSMSMWFKADTTSSNDGLFHIGSLSSESGEFEVQMYNNTLRFRLSNAVWWRQYAFTDTSSWHHLVCIYDTNSESNSKMYIDGVSVGSTNGTFPSDADMDFNGLKTIIGSFFSTSLTFEGSIANVGIWNRALSASEIESIYWRGQYADLKGTELTNLVSWYNLSANANDSTGTNNGTNNGATFLTDAYSASSPFLPRIQDKASDTVANYGEIYGGNAVSFDGTNDYISIADSSDLELGTSDFSFSFWMNLDDVSGTQTIFNRRKDGSNSHWIQVKNTGYLDFGTSHGGSSVIRSQINSSIVSANKWYHIVWSVDRDSTTNIYIDGLKQTLDTNTKDDGANTLDYGVTALIGGFDHSSPSSLFDGSMSGFKYFKGTALTQDQVRELYTKPELTLPTGISSSALKLDMPMQEGSGVAILDGSPVSKKIYESDFSSGVDGWAIKDSFTGISGNVDNIGGLNDNLRMFSNTSTGSTRYIKNTNTVTSGKTYRITFSYYIPSTNTDLDAISIEGTRFTTTDVWTDADIIFNASENELRIYLADADDYLNPSTDGDSAYVRNINLYEIGQNHGTGNGITWATGQEYGFQHPLVRSNNPMVFDGSDDYVDTGASPRALVGSSSAFTVSAWINANDDDNDYIVGAMESGAERFYFRVFDVSGTGYIRWGYGSSASSDTDAPISLNQWHHVVWTYDNTNAKVYVDGSLKNTTSLSGQAITNTDNLYIGALNNNGSSANSWKGFINDVAIWDSALTDNEVTALYNSGLPLLPTADSGNYASADDLVGYWRNDGVTTWMDKANTGVASFAGGADKITINSNLFSGTNATMSGWVKADNLTSSREMFFGSQDSSGSRYDYVVLWEGSSIRVYIEGTLYNTSISLNSNTWYLLTITTDGTNVKLYVNGSLQYTASNSDTLNSGTDFVIGSDILHTLYVFNGQIASTNIFNTALSATEVSELYAIDKRSSISGHSKFSNCVASWLMGAGTGDTTSTIQDQTSNNNDATVSGANLIGYNDGTVAGDPASIIVPEGLNEGRDSQGYYLTDTDSISSGIRFKGAEYINVQDSESLDFANAFTIETWIKPKQKNVYQIFLQKGTGTKSPRLNIAETNGQYTLDIVIGGSHNYVNSTNDAVIVDQWQHLVVTWNGSTGKMYIDGSQNATASISGTQDLNTDPLTIGKSSSSYFTGSLDEVKLYSKELSASEVLKNYNNGKSAHSN